MDNIEKGLMQWRRNSTGVLSLYVKDKGSSQFVPFNHSRIYVPAQLEYSEFAKFQPGFRTAQNGLNQGYEYIKTEN